MTQEKVQKTEVKWVNADTFEKEIIKNKDIEHCVVEVIKDYCPGCMYAKFQTNIISQKMLKHGYLNKVPMFRMKIDN